MCNIYLVFHKDILLPFFDFSSILQIPGPPFPVIWVVSHSSISQLYGVFPEAKCGCVQVTGGCRSKNQHRCPSVSRTFWTTVPLIREEDFCICVSGTFMLTAALELQHQEWELPVSWGRKKKESGDFSHCLRPIEIPLSHSLDSK